MPTTLTAPIEADSVDNTLRAFALRCARQLSEFCDQEDDRPEAYPMIHQEVKLLYIHRKIQAEEKLAKLTAMTDAEWDAEAEQYNTWVQSERDRQSEIAARYDKMLAAAEAWEAPTPDHEGLKMMMLAQIGLAHPYRHGKETFYATEKPRTGAELKARRIPNAERDLAFAQEQLDERARAVAAANEYAAALYASLDALT